MLPEIEKIALFYVLDRAIDWKEEDGDYYDVVSGFKGRSRNFRYGDFVMHSDGLYIMGKHSLKLTDLEYPDKHLEIWKSNPKTGFFMYTGYWDVECVWFNQRKYRTELINNLRILISGNVKIPTTHITINGKEFYIYVCNCGNDGDDLLFESEYKNSEMLEIKERLIEFFKENDKAIYSQQWPGFDVTQEYSDDFFRIIPQDWEYEPAHNVLWLKFEV